MLANRGIEAQGAGSGDMVKSIPWISNDTGIDLLGPNATIRDPLKSVRRPCLLPGAIRYFAAFLILYKVWIPLASRALRCYSLVRSTAENHYSRIPTVVF